jgi:hypothetical protein
MAQATGGSGGQSAYNNQVATLISSATDAVNSSIVMFRLQQTL